MKVLETTVKELNPSETDAVAKASNNVINNMDFNLAPKKAATKRIKQAVAEPIMARLNSFRPDSTRSPGSVMNMKKDVSDRDTMMKRGDLCQRS